MSGYHRWHFKADADRPALDGIFDYLNVRLAWWPFGYEPNTKHLAIAGKLLAQRPNKSPNGYEALPREVLKRAFDKDLGAEDRREKAEYSRSFEN